YIKRNKHDAADAEAICEAVQRPTMRVVPAKTADQQAAVLLHRGRERLVRQRTALVNALRAHLAEFGVVAAQGLRNVGKLIAIVRDEDDARLPDLARQVLQVLAAQIEQLAAAVAAIEKQLMAWHKSNPVSQRLASVPGIGPIIATAIAAAGVEPSGFRSGREFAAWLGLVPRQNSTGGKHRLGGISKRGNQYLRRLLINGASANLLRSKATKADPWVIGLRRRRPAMGRAIAVSGIKPVIDKIFPFDEAQAAYRPWPRERILAKSLSASSEQVLIPDAGRARNRRRHGSRRLVAAYRVGPGFLPLLRPLHPKLHGVRRRQRVCA